MLILSIMTSLLVAYVTIDFRSLVSPLSLNSSKYIVRGEAGAGSVSFLHLRSNTNIGLHLNQYLKELISQ
jgi:hypothetical protein